MKAIYASELKSQVIKEVQGVGNCTLVARRHGLNPKTVNNWVRHFENKDSIAETKKIRELEKTLKDRELEIEVLKSLLKKTYPLWQSAEKL